MQNETKTFGRRSSIIELIPSDRREHQTLHFQAAVSYSWKQYRVIRIESKYIMDVKVSAYLDITIDETGIINQATRS